MSNVIKIKHGSTKPTTENLQGYELGYHSGTLYINDEEKGKVIPVGSGSGSGSGSGGADWDSEFGEDGYVEGRPLWHEIQTVSWDGTVDEEKGKTYEIFLPGQENSENSEQGGYVIYQEQDWVGKYSSGENLVSYDESEINKVRLIDRTTSIEHVYPIDTYCSTEYELMAQFYPGSKKVVAISGAVLKFPATFAIVALIMEDDVIPLLLFVPDDKLFSDDSKKGLYMMKNEDFYCKSMKFNTIVFGEDYRGYFESLNNPIHVLSLQNANQIAQMNFSIFKPGSIILITGVEEEEEV